ncbi:hypothetical protein Chor_014889 [Crotalus horridus]
MASWKYILGSVLGGALLLTAGILLGHFAIPKEGPSPSWLSSVSEDLDPAILEDFMNQVEAANIRENLKKLSAKPHMATTKGDHDLVKLLLERWSDPESGLDKATEIQYDVFLSFPDPKRPNRVRVVLENNTEVFLSREAEEKLTPDQEDPDIGKLVYANQGKMSDYEFLHNQNISLNGTIAITRYGGAGRVAKAINGAKFGVIGVVVYTDPADINDGKSSPKETYPYSCCLCPIAIDQSQISLHPSNVQVDVYNQREIKPSSNVLGVIRGSVEPDRYVLYGNHRDSWVHGAIDPSSGTAVMLEITRILGKMVKEGFTSHRAVAQTAGNVLLRLAESLILPLNVSNYGETLQAMYDTAERVFQVDLLNHNISLDALGFCHIGPDENETDDDLLFVACREKKSEFEHSGRRNDPKSC